MIDIHGDIFKYHEIHNKNVGILHCVSADYVMFYGFAYEIEKRYNLREFFMTVGKHNYPDLIVCDRVFSMVVTPKYWHKINPNILRETLLITRDKCLEDGIDTLLMPKIGCGYGGLNWSDIRDDIKYILDESDINCIVYH